jgi:HNH endonuclease/NUMOD4 motif-containing protein
MNNFTHLKHIEQNGEHWFVPVNPYAKEIPTYDKKGIIDGGYINYEWQHFHDDHANTRYHILNPSELIGREIWEVGEVEFKEQILFEGKYWQTRESSEVKKFVRCFKNLGGSKKEVDSNVRTVCEIIKPKEEVWQPLLNYEGIYEASNLGEVRSVPRKTLIENRNVTPYYATYKSKVLQPYDNGGLLVVNLSKNGYAVNSSVSRVIYTAFNGELPSNVMVLHIDGNYKNLRLNNLQIAPSNCLDTPIQSADEVGMYRYKNTTPLTKVEVAESAANSWFNGCSEPDAWERCYQACLKTMDLINTDTADTTLTTKIENRVKVLERASKTAQAYIGANDEPQVSQGSILNNNYEDLIK